MSFEKRAVSLGKSINFSIGRYRPTTEEQADIRDGSIAANASEKFLDFAEYCREHQLELAAFEDTELRSMCIAAKKKDEDKLMLIVFVPLTTGEKT